MSTSGPSAPRSVLYQSHSPRGVSGFHRKSPRSDHDSREEPPDPSRLAPSRRADADNFKLVETDIPEPGPGQMLLRTIYLSLDPYMRGRMNAGPSYAKPVEVGEVMEGRAVCEVVKSNMPQYKAGDIVLAGTGWQEYALSDGNGVQKLDPAPAPSPMRWACSGCRASPPTPACSTSASRSPARRSWWRRRPGRSARSSARSPRSRAVASSASPGARRSAATSRMNSASTTCLDHRQPDLAEHLKAACPTGIDIYFENVGGAVFEAVLPLLNNFARVPVCGLIAHYNAAELPAGPNRVPQVMHSVLVKRLTFRGFIVGDFASQFPTF